MGLGNMQNTSQLTELFAVFFKIGLFTFGGGYAMIPVIEHECVEKRHWITEQELADVIVIAESTPGPIAINCATFTGYKRAGVAGAVASTVGMIVPSFVIILLIARVFEYALQWEVVQHAFSGIKVAVGVLIVRAAWHLQKQMVHTVFQRILMAAAILVMLITAVMAKHVSVLVLMVAAGIISSLYAAIRERGKADKA